MLLLAILQILSVLSLSVQRPLIHHPCPIFPSWGGIIRYKNGIYIGKGSDLRTKVLEALQSSALGGHSGIAATYQRIKRLFYWPGLKSFVESFVLACDVCQRTKHENIPYPGLLEPLEIPHGAWSHISMDFVEGLPKSEGKNVIMVVVDRFSKYAHFIPLSHPYTASSVARLFLDHIVKLHGQPVSIVTDRDPIFTSSFWSELFKLMGTKLHLTSSYHPQSDGQTERLNQCLENYLRSCTSQHPHKWTKWLALAEFRYNTSHHSSLKTTPFAVLYGYDLPQYSLDPYFHSSNQEASALLHQRNEMLELIKENLIQAQAQMKFYADQKRLERSFEVGDEVYLKLQPFRQNSVVLRHNLKLANKYYGPYTIIEKLGTVAYKLQLPSDAKIHNVFHVSLQKRRLAPITLRFPLFL